MYYVKSNDIVKGEFETSAMALQFAIDLARLNVGIIFQVYNENQLESSFFVPEENQKPNEILDSSIVKDLLSKHVLESMSNDPDPNDIN